MNENNGSRESLPILMFKSLKTISAYSDVAVWASVKGCGEMYIGTVCIDAETCEVFNINLPERIQEAMKEYKTQIFLCIYDERVPMSVKSKTWIMNKDGLSRWRVAAYLQEYALQEITKLPREVCSSIAHNEEYLTRICKLMESYGAKEPDPFEKLKDMVNKAVYQDLKNLKQKALAEREKRDTAPPPSETP